MSRNWKHSDFFQQIYSREHARDFYACYGMGNNAPIVPFIFQSLENDGSIRPWSFASEHQAENTQLKKEKRREAIKELIDDFISELISKEGAHKYSCRVDGTSFQSEIAVIGHIRNFHKKEIDDILHTLAHDMELTHLGNFFSKIYFPELLPPVNLEKRTGSNEYISVLAPELPRTEKLKSANGRKIETVESLISLKRERKVILAKNIFTEEELIEMERKLFPDAPIVEGTTNGGGEAKLIGTKENVKSATNVESKTKVVEKVKSKELQTPAPSSPKKEVTSPSPTETVNSNDTTNSQNGKNGSKPPKTTSKIEKVESKDSEDLSDKVLNGTEDKSMKIERKLRKQLEEEIAEELLKEIVEGLCIKICQRTIQEVKKQDAKEKEEAKLKEIAEQEAQKEAEEAMEKERKIQERKNRREIRKQESDKVSEEVVDEVVDEEIQLLVEEALSELQEELKHPVNVLFQSTTNPPREQPVFPVASPNVTVFPQWRRDVPAPSITPFIVPTPPVVPIPPIPMNPAPMMQSKLVPPFMLTPYNVHPNVEKTVPFLNPKATLPSAFPLNTSSGVISPTPFNSTPSVPPLTQPVIQQNKLSSPKLPLIEDVINPEEDILKDYEEEETLTPGVLYNPLSTEANIFGSPYLNLPSSSEFANNHSEKPKEQPITSRFSVNSSTFTPKSTAQTHHKELSSSDQSIMLRSIPEDYGMDTNRCVVCQNVTPNTKKIELISFFKDCTISVGGPPDFSSKIQFLKALDAGCCFVEFETATDVEKALEKNGQKIGDIVIKVARPSGAMTSGSGQKFALNISTRNAPSQKVEEKSIKLELNHEAKEFKPSKTPSSSSLNPEQDSIISLPSKKGPINSRAETNPIGKQQMNSPPNQTGSTNAFEFPTLKELASKQLESTNQPQNTLDQTQQLNETDLNGGSLFSSADNSGEAAFLDRFNS